MLRGSDPRPATAPSAADAGQKLSTSPSSAAGAPTSSPAYAQIDWAHPLAHAVATMSSGSPGLSPVAPAGTPSGVDLSAALPPGKRPGGLTIMTGQQPPVEAVLSPASLAHLFAPPSASSPTLATAGLQPSAYNLASPMQSGHLALAPAAAGGSSGTSSNSVTASRLGSPASVSVSTPLSPLPYSHAESGQGYFASQQGGSSGSASASNATLASLLNMPPAAPKRQPSSDSLRAVATVWPPEPIGASHGQQSGSPEDARSTQTSSQQPSPPTPVSADPTRSAGQQSLAHQLAMPASGASTGSLAAFYAAQQGDGYSLTSQATPTQPSFPSYQGPSVQQQQQQHSHDRTGAHDFDHMSTANVESIAATLDMLVLMDGPAAAPLPNPAQDKREQSQSRPHAAQQHSLPRRNSTASLPGYATQQQQHQQHQQQQHYAGQSGEWATQQPVPAGGMVGSSGDYYVHDGAAYARGVPRRMAASATNSPASMGPAASPYGGPAAPPAMPMSPVASDSYPSSGAGGYGTAVTPMGAPMSLQQGGGYSHAQASMRRFPGDQGYDHAQAQQSQQQQQQQQQYGYDANGGYMGGYSQGYAAEYAGHSGYSTPPPHMQAFPAYAQDRFFRPGSAPPGGYSDPHAHPPNPYQPHQHQLQQQQSGPRRGSGSSGSSGGRGSYRGPGGQQQQQQYAEYGAPPPQQQYHGAAYGPPASASSASNTSGGAPRRAFVYGGSTVPMHPPQYPAMMHQPQPMHAGGGGGGGHRGNRGGDSRYSSGDSMYDRPRGRGAAAAQAIKMEVEARFAGLDLESVKGQYLVLAKEQHGCRFLQRKLEEGGPEAATAILEEVLPRFSELMADPFGNFLCQKLLEHVSDPQKSAILEQVTPQLAFVSLNMHGTRAVQKLVEHVSTSAQAQLLVDALRPHTVTLIKDLNGNHVIQKCLVRLAPADAQFIYDAVTQQCVEVSTHRHGCCVIQRCLDYASPDQRRRLAAEITAHSLQLVKDPFSNYVVQYVLDMGDATFVDAIAARLRGHVVELSAQKFASNVMEKSIRVTSPELRVSLIAELFASPEVLDTMLRDGYANYVVQSAIDFMDMSQRAQLLDRLSPLIPLIRNTPYGKRIMSKLNLVY